MDRRRLLQSLAALSCPALSSVARAASNRRPVAAPIPLTAAMAGLHETRTYPRDGGHTAWRVTVVTPPGLAPAAGWPVLYLLDGNAALQSLPQAWRDAAPGAALDSGVPVVMVTIGYDTGARFEVDTRAWDYTPLPASARGKPIADPRAPRRLNGGADAFLAFLQRLHASLAARLPLDPARRTLYGHSYGGLFVLHVLLSQPDAFDRYVAASPSLWWHAPEMLNRVAQAPARSPGLTPAALHVVVGGEERVRAHADAHAHSGHRTQGQTELFMEALATRPDLRTSLRVVPGASHGAMFAASLPDALSAAIRP